MRTRPTLLRIFLLLPAALLLEPAHADVSVRDAWVRATVQGQSSTGAYLVISSDREVTLNAASSGWADRCALHEMKMHGDMMMMMPIEKLPVTPGKALVLDEKNYHIMLEGLKRQVRAGDKVPLTLTFIDAKGARQQVAVAAVARELAARDERAHEHMGQ